MCVYILTSDEYRWMDTAKVARSFLGLVGVSGYMIRTLPWAADADVACAACCLLLRAVPWEESQQEWCTVLWNLTAESR